MKYYFAPMEGITYPQYRKVHAMCFPGVDAYFSPFIPTGTYDDKFLLKHFPDKQYGIPLIPQIIANNSHSFISTANRIMDYGYNHINLNAGCPSGTVFSKHKGSGMLRDLNSLDSFLSDIFEGCATDISVKTRMGVDSTQEFSSILHIYNKYPIKELIIHSRDRRGMYKSAPDIDMFVSSFHDSVNPVCYNGDIFTSQDLEKIVRLLPDIKAVMIGRGVVCNPALIRILKGGTALLISELEEFLANLLEEYLLSSLSPVIAADRMKNLWQEMICLFPGSETEYKLIKKARGVQEYSSAVNSLIHSCCFNGSLGYCPHQQNLT